MPRFVACAAWACVLIMCGSGTAQQTRTSRAKALERYQAALQYLAGGKHEEACSAAREAIDLHPKYKPYEQLLALLEPTAKRNKLRKYALAATAEDESSIERLAQYLKKGADDDEWRAWLLFCWITDRIAYDVQAFLSGAAAKKDPSPANVLKTRLAVCAGYSNLYTAVAKEMGLDVISISGHARGLPSDKFSLEDQKFAHAWNAVRIEGKWRPIDSTWGAGAVKEDKFEKRFVPFYFCPPPQALVLTHFPSKPEDQFVTPPISAEQFSSRPFNLPSSLRALLAAGFDPSLLQDKLNQNIQLVEAFSVPFPIKVQAPLERVLDSRKSYTIKVESLALADVAIIHDGKWRFATRRGDTFTCLCRGIEGEIVIGVKPLGEKDYKHFLKYRGDKAR